MNYRWLLIALCALAVRVEAADTTGAPPDTGSLLQEKSGTDSADTVIARIRNPLLAGALSAVVPGAGQAYNRQFVKSVLFLGAEAAFIGAAVYRFGDSQKYNDSIARFEAARDFLLNPSGPAPPSLRFDSSEVNDTTVDSTGTHINTVSYADTALTAVTYGMRADTTSFKQMRERHATGNAITWAAGCYLWSILDAVEKTGRFANDEERNPTLAGWLSAVPGLGLGQFYNGRLSKAGMVIMVQTSLAMMSYHYHAQFTECERQLQIIESENKAEYTVDRLYGGTFRAEWHDMREDAFRNRNTYLWYSIFFYFYGIFDAVVDAHLHDYRSRMRLVPDLDIPSQKVGMRLNIDLRP
jgi:TM2 domain-containing membrane protein YozV